MFQRLFRRVDPIVGLIFGPMLLFAAPVILVALVAQCACEDRPEQDQNPAGLTITVEPRAPRGADHDRRPGGLGATRASGASLTSDP